MSNFKADKLKLWTCCKESLTLKYLLHYKYLHPKEIEVPADFSEADESMLYLTHLITRGTFSSEVVDIDEVVLGRLGAPAKIIQDQVFIFSNFHLMIYYLRKDVASIFDISTREGREGYLKWFFQYCFEPSLLNNNPLLMELALLKPSCLNHNISNEEKISFLSWLINESDVFPQAFYRIDFKIFELLRTRLPNGLMLFEQLIWKSNKSLQETFLLSNQLEAAEFRKWVVDYWILKDQVAPEIHLKKYLLQEVEANPNQYLSLGYKNLKILDTNNEPSKTISGGVNIIGFPRAEFGLGEDCKMTSLALVNQGVDISIMELSHDKRLPHLDNRVEKYISNFQPYPITITNLPGVEQYSLVYDYGLNLFKGRYNIGFWPWEFPAWDSKLEFCFDLIDEVWAPSTFIAETYRKKTDTPVFEMPLGVSVDRTEKYERKHFLLPDNKFLFLFVFDANSFIQRKNPLAVVEAFYKAFPSNINVGLVVKTMNTSLTNPYWQNFLEMTRHDERIKIIDSFLSRDELLSLYECVDVFVSLHRAEGFGRCLAESMMLGTPVIATNFSGNVDFTKPDNSCLVEYELVRVQEGEYVYVDINDSEFVWANPSVEQAAFYMVKLFEDKSFREHKSLNGKKFIEKNYSLNKVGELYKNRIKEIYKTYF